MAWDRPVKLNRKLDSGARLAGDCVLGPDAGLPLGRLGGGGAIAAAALVEAGHQATVIAPVGNSDEGDAIVRATSALGVKTDHVIRVPQLGVATLLLIEPNGERVILSLGDKRRPQQQTAMIQQHLSESITRALGRQKFDGVFLRAHWPGITELFENTAAPILSHAPTELTVGADYTMASRDDLYATGLKPKELLHATGERCTAAIVTNGARAGRAYTRDGKKIDFQAPPTEQIDATGAGDTFGAGFLEAITSGASLTDALKHAATWGALAVSREGGTFETSRKLLKPFRRS